MALQSATAITRERSPVAPRQDRRATDNRDRADDVRNESDSPTANGSPVAERQGYEGAFIAAQRRLYEHLCQTTEHRPATLPGLQPLYQAVAHGCLAGLQQQACDDVYFERITRGEEYYSTRELGAIGADLGAVACFFETPWSRLSPNLSPAAQAWLLNAAAIRLRALGRLTDALGPIRQSLKMAVAQENWKSAAIRASNLSELELTLSSMSAAVTAGEQSVAFADRSKDAFHRMSKRTTLADALHQAGRADDRRMGTLARPSSSDRPNSQTDQDELTRALGTGKSAHPPNENARSLFEEAERLQAERQPKHPQLYSMSGFRYCDLLLADAERAAWRVTLEYTGSTEHSLATEPLSFPHGATAKESGSAATQSGAEPPHSKVCDAVTQRAEGAQKAWREIFTNKPSLLLIALDHLTLGRAALYRALLSVAGSRREPGPVSARPDHTHAFDHLTAAVDGLRASGASNHLPRGLVTRAWYRFLVGDEPGCRADLDEAWEIAERGSMRLFQADVQLTRARLFRNRAALHAARTLIEETGYGRRLPELADAEAAARDWPSP